MSTSHCAYADVYISACKQEHAQCSEALIRALDTGAKAAVLGHGEVPLNDVDMCCVAELVRILADDSTLRVLVLEENSFGLQGISSLMEAIEANPNRIRELRLGKNNLRDQAAVVIGDTLSRGGCGLKVLDLSENGITKLGVIPIAAALQQPFSDIVELSFHNNKIEGDAATYLGAALRSAPKLKHLHLGYNSLRDTGAAQIARSVPYAVCLSTLDLTANRIGREGGEELIRALLSPTCSVQRLNLRHNQLNSSTIEEFADVVSRNTALIQLFLGFMNPSPDAAAAVLAAVPQNRSLLLLDIYGWKLDSPTMLQLVQNIQQRNSTIAAIVTDACESIAPQVDEVNVIREEERDLHPVYVGPDDRDAYLATKSLRRYSRAQSHRQSRTTSRIQSRARGESQPHSRAASSRRRSDREGSHRASRRSSRAASQSNPDAAIAEASERPRRSSSRHSHHSHHRSSSSRHRHRDSADTGATPTSATLAATAPVARSHSRLSPSGTSPRADGGRSPKEAARSPRSTRLDESAKSPRTAPAAAQLVPSAPAPKKATEPGVDALLEELLQGPCDSNTTAVLKNLFRVVQKTCTQQRVRIESLTARVSALESRRECRCGMGTAATREHSPQQQQQRTSTSPVRPAAGPAAAQKASAPPSATGSPDRTATPPASQTGRQPSAANGPLFSSVAKGPRGGANGRHGGSTGSTGSTNVAALYQRLASQVGSSSAPRINSAGPLDDSNAEGNVHSSAFQRSISRMSQNTNSSKMERPTTPSAMQDMPPEIAHPNDESGDLHPEGVELQRSAIIPSFPPRIEPSPARDSMPPHRKSVSHAF